MSAFDLGAAIDGLSYDFTTGPAGWDEANGAGKGAIGDPTRGQIRDFQRSLSAALGVPTGSQEELSAALAALDADGQERLAEAMLDALAALCGGTPSRAELAALSVRAFNAFTGFIYGVLFEASPTQPASGTNSSLAIVRSA